jgi:transcriptional regulator with XRE-family HTH domain
MAAGYVPIGQRIAIIRRRRGMSQAALAGLLDRSAQWLSGIERGRRSADRYSLLVAFAEALRVSVTELTGAPTDRDAPAASDRPNDAVKAVRLALSPFAFTDRDDAPVTDVVALGPRVREAWALAHQARYAEIGRVVPDLVRDCERAAWSAAEERREAPFRLLAELYQAIAATMAKLGEADAAWVAGDRSTFAAAQARNPALAAAGAFRLGHAFLSAGNPDQAERTAALAAAAIAPSVEAGEADSTALWGALRLVRAVAAARRGDRQSAEAALADAEAASVRLGRGQVERRFETEFGARNVALHAIAVAVELGDAAEALRRWAELDTTGLSAERRARALVDVARAHAQRRRAGAAVRALEEAERLAPELVRRHWRARETVRDLLRRERGRAKPGRHNLAARMGLV